MNQIEIGKFIAACRKNKNMTQNQLAEMLKYKLYQFSDKSISFAEFDHTLNKIAEVTTILKQCGSKEAAVDYLVKGTNLPIEECAAAYDYYMKLFKIN